jgi:hypothetical protein
MLDFQYIAFDLNTGKSISYGEHETTAVDAAKKLAGHHSGFTFTVLFCGEAGPYVWAEKLTLRRTNILLDTIITEPQKVAVKSVATQLEEMRG